MPSLKKLLANLLLLVVSSAVCLFLLEMAYRFYLFGADTFSIEKMNSVHDIGLSGFLQRSSHPGLIFELKPNLDTYFKLVPFQTNSRGLRDKEYTIEKPAGVLRVAVVGDSFTLPSGVAIEDAYHSVIEERLNQRRTSGGHEIINFAVGGYTLKQYALIIRAKALEYAPDLILIGFCAGNDDQVFQPERFPAPFDPKERTFPFYGSFALDAAILKIQSWRMEQEMRPDLSERQRRYLARVFSELASLGAAEDIPIVIVYLWNQPSNYRPIEELARSNGIEHFLDVSSAFRQTQLDDYRILPIDNHPNARAHQIFADRIYEYLVRNDLLRRQSRE